MVRDLDVQMLRAFLAVAETGGFTRAAPRVHRSQSAVSMQIKKLEEIVDASVFERASGGVRLTAVGERLVSHARRMVDLNDAALGDLRSEEVSGPVRIGVMDDYATHVLPPIFAAFKRRFPKIALEVSTGMTAALLRDLGARFDLVLATQPLGGGGRVLRTDEVCWAYAEHEAPRQDPVELALLTPGNLFRGWAVAALDAAGRAWRVVFTSTSISAVEAAAAAGVAVTVVKRRTVRPGLRLLSPADGFPPLPTAEIALHEMSGSQPPAARQLSDFLEREIGQSS